MPLSFCLPRLTRGIIFALLLLGTAYGQDVLETNRGKVVFIQAFPDADMLPTEVRAAGTGVLLKDGYVLTARHFDEQGPKRARDDDAHS